MDVPQATSTTPFSGRTSRRRLRAGGQLPEGSQLKKAIERDFGSVEEFKKKFNAATAAIQGSGWGWLVSLVPVSLFRAARHPCDVRVEIRNEDADCLLSLMWWMCRA